MNPITCLSRLPKRTFTLLFVYLLSTIALPVWAGNGHTECKDGEKTSEFGRYCGYSSDKYKGYKYDSEYIMMRDSVMIAADIFLPKKADKGEKFPTILYQTRYIRSLRAKWPFSMLKNPVLAVIPEDEIKYFTSHGYACVIIDARGSGASTGSRSMEFSPDEVKDGAEVVDWIIAQPWSDQKVGATGVSYYGTTAELLLINQHPNVLASVPRSNIFDLYNHIMFPGGVRQGPFVDIWGFTTQSLDANDLDPFGKQARRLIKGASPVKGDKGRKIYKQAQEDHKKNFDVYSGIQQIDFRDETVPGQTESSDAYSIHSNMDKVEGSGTPIFRIGGWYDGALKKSVIEGYWNTENTTRCMIGPWDHGPGNNASPFSGHTDVKFDVWGEILRYFDYHLKGVENGIEDEKLFHYFTIGEEQWKHSDVWPPAEVQNVNYYFSADKSLTPNKTAVEIGKVDYKIDYTCHTGISSRWNSMTGLYKNGPTNYDIWEEQTGKLLHFNTAPFTADVEMTGNPVIELYMQADAKDATVFVYLEDVAPDGEVTLITEGQFRAINRKVVEPKDDYIGSGPYHSYLKADAMPLEPGETALLTFDILPISYQIKKGHSLRVAIAGTDCKHFDLLEENPTKFVIDVQADKMPKIMLPLVGGGAKL